MLDYSAALDLLLQHPADWGQETVPLAEATGRILAEPLVTDRPQPPFDRVAMDGVAVDYAAFAAGRRRFTVCRTQFAGDAPQPNDGPDYCTEIMTGAALPPGVDTVVPYEAIERTDDGQIVLPEDVRPRQNVHRRGGDAGAGLEVAPVGTRITGGVANLLATCGYARVRVRKWPRITCVATGSELVAVADEPLPHQIRMSNLYQLRAELAGAGMTAELRHLPDDPALLRHAVAGLMEANDVLLFSGGVSRGKKDLLPDVLDELGVAKFFHRVRIRPGKPLWVGRASAGAMVFGLPGNPVSGVVGLHAFVAPWLRASLGCAPAAPAPRHPLGAAVHFPKDLTLFRAVAIDPLTQAAHPVAAGGSGDAASLLRTGGYAVLPRERDDFGVGEWVEVIGSRGLL